jgi:hypothetical protein
VVGIQLGVKRIAVQFTSFLVDEEINEMKTKWAESKQSKTSGRRNHTSAGQRFSEFMYMFICLRDNF